MPGPTKCTFHMFRPSHDHYCLIVLLADFLVSLYFFGMVGYIVAYLYFPLEIYEETKIEFVLSAETNILGSDILVLSSTLQVLCTDALSMSRYIKALTFPVTTRAECKLLPM